MNGRNEVLGDRERKNEDWLAEAERVTRKEERRIKKRKRQEAEEEKKERADEKQIETEPQTEETGLTVQSFDSYWRVPNVEYRDELYPVDLAKEPLPERTQEEHAQHRNQAGEDEFVAASMPLYHSLFAALYRQRDSEEAEEAREFIKEQMRNNFPVTLTRIAYQPNGEDRVIHNWGTNDIYDLEANIIGPGREIISADEYALEALLGTNDVEEIKEVYGWINSTPTKIWRLYSKPEEEDERVARFDAGSVRANLNCNRHPSNSRSSLGVRVREAHSQA